MSRWQTCEVTLAGNQEEKMSRWQTCEVTLAGNQEEEMSRRHSKPTPRVSVHFGVPRVQCFGGSIDRSKGAAAQRVEMLQRLERSAVSPHARSEAREARASIATVVLACCFRLFLFSVGTFFGGLK